MGNSASSSGRVHHEDTVDFGHLSPQGVYSGTRDWKEDVVTQRIIDRKLAPFYRPLEEYDPSWDDEQILAARKEPPLPAEHESTGTRSDATPTVKSTHHKRPSVSKELPRSAEAAIYKDAAECPICFLYYPSNINRSRCCDQAICTECFVQIKRTEPTVTHMVSEPACCPFCVQEHFGIIYTPPFWRTGIGCEGWPSPTLPDSPKDPQRAFDSMKVKPGKQKRFKSFDHTDPDVVTVDQVHPDWEAKLAAVQAAAARRANRRIIMRQVGDRLVPVGITSGRVHPLSVEGAEGEGGGSRRSRRRQQQQQQDLNSFLGNMGFGARDVEELMMMEAMRLSLLEHDAQQRREAEERARNGAEDSSSSRTRAESRNSPSSSPPNTEATSDAASPTVLPTLATPTFDDSPASSSTPNLTTVSLPAPQQLRENPPNGPSNNNSVQGASSPYAVHSPLSRMDSLASSIATHETSAGDGYRFLPSESEDSFVSREPLLHVEETDA
ncbi:hypothetical protein EI94DRAFT_1584820 [Lactarius quietus]|nr:hypothetical protein EI94DRAFT_1584820 [Lactarius quietus]